MNRHFFLAFDLGATSGRTVLGIVNDQRVELRELTRFPNTMLHFGGHCYWDIHALYRYIVEGLKAAAREGIPLRSVGIDTWGVDFAFVGDDGALLGLPFAYRDRQTDGMAARFFTEELSRERVYELTGIQVMDFNTLYQLYALGRNASSQLRAAHRLLFMPDALAYMLTGKMVTEYTVASTSQLLDSRGKCFSGELFRRCGLSSDLFPPVVMPGTEIGPLRPEIADESGLGPVSVVAVAGHDTASAVAAVPAEDRNFAYLSSGTWSLMGVELPAPVISPDTLRWNITNEGGVDGTTRLLKNITGMWILERILEEWKARGDERSYDEVVRMAAGVEDNSIYIDPDDERFASPRSMLQAVADYCLATGQPRPGDDDRLVRALFESLALKYRCIFDLFVRLAPFPIRRLHVFGGGSRNELLNAMTADSVGVEVVAGPAEATALGNIMLQAKAAGVVDSLAGMRRLIAGSVATRRYQPRNPGLWQEKYETFLKIITR